MKKVYRFYLAQDMWNQLRLLVLSNILSRSHSYVKKQKLYIVGLCYHGKNVSRYGTLKSLFE